jgi:hypothetical protein
MLRGAHWCFSVFFVPVFLSFVPVYSFGFSDGTRTKRRTAAGLHGKLQLALTCVGCGLISPDVGCGLIVSPDQEYSANAVDCRVFLVVSHLTISPTVNLYGTGIRSDHG